MRLLVLIVLLSVYGMAEAQDTIAVSSNGGRRPVLSDTIPDSFVQKLDYFYSAWYVNRQDNQDYVDSAYISASLATVEPCSDSLYLLRIDSLNSAVQLSFNEIVRNYIELYTVRKRFQLGTMMGLSEYYFPMFEEELAANRMPLELKFLPVIESALNPRALSRAGACGLWQFMYSTGKMYKLEINSYVDERMDPMKSTRAAVRYLNDLYGLYGDWILVIADYNCGPGNVNKAIRRSGGKKNYWDIYYNLPKETRGYVPAFIAAIYSFNYAKNHKVFAIESSLPIMCDSLEIEDALHFEQISQKLDISTEQLRDMNPQYKADVIPAGYGKCYVLKMPYNHVMDFVDNQDSIFANNRSKYFNDADRVADPKERIKVHATVIGQDDKARLVYTVRSGDVPGAIASKFNVTLADLKYWNNLNRRMTIHPGQKLVVYVSDKKAAQYKSNADYAGKVTNTTNAPKVETVDGEFVYYTVRKGESLWMIAKKYPGVTDADIMRWNGISRSEVKDIKPGQKLKIKI